MLNAIKTESNFLITLGGTLMFLAGAVYLFYEHEITSRSRSKSNTSPTHLSRMLMGLQIGVILLTIFVTRSSVSSLQAKLGLPLGNQVIGWVALIASVILPFTHRLAPNSHYLHRLVIIFLTFSPTFVLLSISYEGLFYVSFCALLLTWVRLEHAIYVHQTKSTSPKKSPSNGVVVSSITPTSTDITPRMTTRTLTLHDLRTSLIFLFLLQSAFFSTGNIASISSFSLDAVYRLIPIFDPFSQGALLMYKILVPFALISAALGILNRRLGLASSALFMCVMGVSDYMAMRFFWMVKDEGSWLEIGSSISEFCIAGGIGVFVAGLEGVSEVLIQGVEVGDVVIEGGARGKEKVVKGMKREGNGVAKAGKGKGEKSEEKEKEERFVID
jgi:GPI ethanolamine phosphate transferase 1